MMSNNSYGTNSQNPYNKPLPSQPNAKDSIKQFEADNDDDIGQGIPSPYIYIIITIYNNYNNYINR